MITIRYDRSLPELVVRGHAGYAPAGQDIVCAGVSGAVAMLEALLPEHPKAEFIHEPGYSRLFVPGRKARKTFDRGVFMLQSLAAQYRANIRVEILHPNIRFPELLVPEAEV